MVRAGFVLRIQDRGSASSKKVVKGRPFQMLLLLTHHSETMAPKECRHSCQVVIQVMRFHYDLFDPGPVGLFNTGEYVKLAFLDIDFQKINSLDVVLAN